MKTFLFQQRRNWWFTSDAIEKLRVSTSWHGEELGRGEGLVERGEFRQASLGTTY
jgi:hypothetical protein